jgi:hypothetical protein
VSMIPINTAALALPVAVQPAAATGADPSAVPALVSPTAASLGQTNPDAAQLFAMLLAQLTEGKTTGVGIAQAAVNKPDTEMTAAEPKLSNPKEADSEQPAAALSVIPVLAALNPELLALPNAPIAKPVSLAAQPPDGNSQVIAPKVSIMNVPTASLPDQIVSPPGQPGEHHAPFLLPDEGVFVANATPEQSVSSQPPIAIPDSSVAASRIPTTSPLFSSSIETPAHQVSTTPVPDHPSLLPTSQADAQQNAITTPAGPVVGSVVLSSTGAERHDVQKPELQREAARQDSTAQQAVSDQITLGSEKIPVELVAASAPSSHPRDVPAPVPFAKVTATVPETVPAMVPSRETLHVQLGPSELGRVTLQVSVQSQQVQATVGVEHHGLGQYLTASQGALDDALRHHGLRIEEFHVETLGGTDVSGLGAGRTGLDQGSPEREASQFYRPEEHTPYAEVHLPETGRIPLDGMSSRYRINVFA